MARSFLLAAAFGTVQAARVSRKRAGNRIGSVPILGEPSLAAGEQQKFLVYFQPKTPDSVLEDFCAGQCIYQGHPDAGGLAFVVMNSETAMTKAVTANQVSVQAVEYDGELEDDMVAEDGSAAAAGTWGTQRVGTTRARGAGEGVNIYVLDSGVRVTHEDFEGRAIPTLDAMGHMPPKVCDAGDTRCAGDNRGHGSHCAGSAGGKTFGVAPKATIRAMNRGRGFSDAWASMDWLVMNSDKPAVVTCSFGSHGEVAGARAAVDAVVASGITVTVSAGNRNYDACQKTFSFIPSAISVGSTDSTDRRSSFSNFGECVHIWAPGSSIPSADYRSDDGTSIKSGTSMANPHVAGGVAVILSVEPDLSPEKVRQRLLETAEKDVISDGKNGPNFFLNIGA